MDDAQRQRLERLLDGYFDTKTGILVERVVATATPEQLADPEAMDQLLEDVVGLLAERYARADPGWRAGTEDLLRAEFDRQVERTLAFERSLEP